MKTLQYFGENPVDLFEHNDPDFINEIDKDNIVNLVDPKLLLLSTIMLQYRNYGCYLLSDILDYTVRSSLKKMSELIHKGLLGNHKKIKLRIY